MSGYDAVSQEAVPLRLPSMAPDAVAARNALYAGVTAFSCGWRGYTWAVSLPTRVVVSSWQVSLHLSIGGMPTTLYLDSPLPVDWAASGLDAADVSALPEALLTALLEVRCEDLLRVVEALCGVSVRLKFLEVLKPDGESPFYPEGSLPLRLEREDGNVVHGLLLGQPELWTLLASALMRQGSGLTPLHAARADDTQLAILPLSVPVLLGTLALEFGEIRSLELGDVLLPAVPEQTTPQVPKVFLELTPRCTLLATWQNGTLGVEECVMPLTDPQNENVTEGNGMTSLHPDDIPVQLRFEVGELRLTLGELRTLKPGHVFATGRQTTEPVRITANGAVLGEGALVDVNGVLGVRLTSLRWLEGNTPEQQQPEQPTELPSASPEEYMDRAAFVPEREAKA